MLPAIGRFALVLLTLSPFEHLLAAALDGRVLNPLLQDPGMLIHRPMLYRAYVGFAMASAFAVAALLGGLVAVPDRRYRLAAAERQAALHAAAAAP